MFEEPFLHTCVFLVIWWIAYSIDGYFRRSETDTGDFIKGVERNLDMNEHYKHGEIECIDAIRAALTEEEFRGFVKGNIIKYAWREKYKGGDYDIDKIIDYACMLVE